MSDDWLPRRALVLGLARSGRAAVAALERRGVEVLAVDRTLGNEDPAAAATVDLLVKSPGVPGEAPVVVAAREHGVPVWSEVELGYRLLDGNPLLGVTGTNGKTTTTELLGAILRAAGRRVEVAGNVGTALTEVADRIEPGASVVCELSSFQLEDVHELSCDVAVLLNLEPDHLDRHGTFEAYRDAKLRIFERARAKVAPRGFGIDGAIEFSGDDPLPAEPLIPGAHNRENAAAATAAARAAGVDDAAIAEALRTFPGVAHRLELVRELRGVRYVNDSKATNVAAARRALVAYDAPLHVILGGSRKGEDFGPLAQALAVGEIYGIHLIGETAEEIAAALDAVHVRYDVDGDLATAVAHAAENAVHGDVVLLSPASASFDQYANFEERGADFRRIVEALR